MSYGIVEIQGRQYQTRHQVFSAQVAVTVANQIFTNLQVTLPGVADFLLRGLTRQVIVPEGEVFIPGTNNFLFRLGNTDGAIWYNSAGVGGTNERVLDTLFFGDGRFPYALSPPIFYGANAAIKYEVEDISASVPYTIYFGFQGSYLVPIPIS